MRCYVAMLFLTLASAAMAADLPQANPCNFQSGGFAPTGGAAPAHTITMKNDGGWCGHTNRSVQGSLVFGPSMHVTHQPAHGEVSIEQRSNGTVVSYRPARGY